MANLTRFLTDDLDAKSGIFRSHVSGNSGEFYNLTKRGVDVLTGIQGVSGVYVSQNQNGFLQIGYAGTNIYITGIPIVSGSIIGLGGISVFSENGNVYISGSQGGGGGSGGFLGLIFTGSNIITGLVDFHTSGSLHYTRTGTNGIILSVPDSYPANNPSGYLTAATAGGVNLLNEISGSINLVSANGNLSILNVGNDIQFTVPNNSHVSVTGSSELSQVNLIPSGSATVNRSGQGTVIIGSPSISGLQQIFYPRFENPSGYLISSDLTGVNSINGIVGNITISSLNSGVIVGQFGNTVTLRSYPQIRVTGSSYYPNDPTFNDVNFLQSGSFRVSSLGGNIRFYSPNYVLSDASISGESFIDSQTTGDDKITFAFRKISGVSGSRVENVGGILLFTTSIEATGIILSEMISATGQYLNSGLMETGAYLYNLIQTSAAGVSSLNGLSGTMNIVGVSGTIVRTGGLNTIEIGRPIYVENSNIQPYFDLQFENNSGVLSFGFRRTGIKDVILRNPYHLSGLNFTEYGEVSASSNDSIAWKSVDDANDYWYAASRGKNGYLDYHFFSPAKINQYFMSGERIFSTGDSFSPPSGWSLSGSHDRKYWSLLHSVSDFSGTNDSSGLWNFPNEDYYKYYRFHVESSQDLSSNSSLNIAYLKYYETGTLEGIQLIEDNYNRSTGNGTSIYENTRGGISYFKSFEVRGNLSIYSESGNIFISGETGTLTSIERLNESGSALISLIQNSNTGVLSLNEMAGFLRITGDGNNYVQIDTGNKTITINHLPYLSFSGGNYLTGQINVVGSGGTYLRYFNNYTGTPPIGYKNGQNWVIESLTLNGLTSGDIKITGFEGVKFTKTGDNFITAQVDKFGLDSRVNSENHTTYIGRKGVVGINGLGGIPIGGSTSTFSWRAFDGNGLTYWMNSVVGSTGFIEYEFNEPQVISSYGLQGLGGFYPDLAAPTSWRISGTKDGTNWDLLDYEPLNSTSVNAYAEYAISGDRQAAYRKYRLHILSRSHNNDLSVNIWNLLYNNNKIPFWSDLIIKDSGYLNIRKESDQFSVGVNRIQRINPTPNTVASGVSWGVITASSDPANAWKIFQGNILSPWGPSVPCWVNTQFNSGIKIFEYDVYNYYESFVGVRGLASWDVSGSYDGSNWYLLDSRTNSTPVNTVTQWKYTIDENIRGNYLHYRFLVKSTLNGAYPQAFVFYRLDYFQESDRFLFFNENFITGTNSGVQLISSKDQVSYKLKGLTGAGSVQVTDLGTHLLISGNNIGGSGGGNSNLSIFDTVLSPTGLDSYLISFPSGFAFPPIVNATIEVLGTNLYYSNISNRTTVGYTLLLSDIIRESGVKVHTIAGLA